MSRFLTPLAVSTNLTAGKRTRVGTLVYHAAERIQPFRRDGSLFEFGGVAEERKDKEKLQKNFPFLITIITPKWSFVKTYSHLRPINNKKISNKRMIHEPHACR